MTRAPLVAGLAAAATAAGVVAPSAQAFFGLGATPVSVSLQRLEQADARTLSTDLSSDGRYVVFA